VSDLVNYYRRRAEEYEEVYHRPDAERQKEQDLMAEVMKDHLRGRDVIDLACGTGYWDRILSETARKITGVDVSAEVLDIARTKVYRCPTEFRVGDAYDPPFSEASFDGALTTMWISHIPRDRVHGFIESMHRVLRKGSRVFVADNAYVEGVGGRLVRREGDENTYKLRTLKDGSEHLVLKNYYTPAGLAELFGGHVEGFTESNIHYGRGYWWAGYTLP
jgi:ubiquinone/menaquinone biosynthesis C-methylase UbiE